MADERSYNAVMVEIRSNPFDNEALDVARTDESGTRTKTLTADEVHTLRNYFTSAYRPVTPPPATPTEENENE